MWGGDSYRVKVEGSFFSHKHWKNSGSFFGLHPNAARRKDEESSKKTGGEVSLKGQTGAAGLTPAGWPEGSVWSLLLPEGKSCL